MLSFRLSLSPIEDEVSDMDGPAVLVGQLESDKEEQRVAWKRSQASYLQLFCPALEVGAQSACQDRLLHAVFRTLTPYCTSIHSASAYPDFKFRIARPGLEHFLGQ